MHALWIQPCLEKHVVSTNISFQLIHQVEASIPCKLEFPKTLYIYIYIYNTEVHNIGLEFSTQHTIDKIKR